MSEHLIPIVASIPSLSFGFTETPDNPHLLTVKSYAPYKRFAVTVEDDGLITAGLRKGDYAILREQRWPNDECQVCMLAFGDDVTLRLIEGIWDTEPTIRVPGDGIPPQTRNRNDFIVLGVLDGIVNAHLANVVPQKQENFDWGC